MSDNRELDETLDPEPLTSHEIVCYNCWLAYNSALDRCPHCDQRR